MAERNQTQAVAYFGGFAVEHAQCKPVHYHHGTLRNCRQFFLNPAPCALIHVQAALGKRNQIDAKTQQTEFLNQTLVVGIPAGASIEIAGIDEIELGIGLNGMRITGTVTLSRDDTYAEC